MTSTLNSELTDERIIEIIYPHLMNADGGYVCDTFPKLVAAGVRAVLAAQSPAAPNEPAQALPALPNEVQLRKVLKEIPLCYPWGTGRKLVREGESREWVSERESTGSKTVLAEINQNIVNSTIDAVCAAIASCRDLPAKDAALPRRPKAHSISGKDLNSPHVLYTSGQMDAYGKECFEAGAAASSKGEGK